MYEVSLIYLMSFDSILASVKQPALQGGCVGGSLTYSSYDDPFQIIDRMQLNAKLVESYA